VTIGGYWVCDACHSLNEPRYNACYKCRVKRGAAKPQPIIPGATTGDAVSRHLGAPAGDIRGDPSAAAALFIGAAVAVLLTAFWYWFEAGIHFAQGRAAWVVGVLIAMTVLVAGTLGGRRRVSFILPVISFVLTLVTVVVGEYLIASATLVPPSTDTQGLIPIAQPVEVGRAVIGYWETDPLRPILWLLALAAGWLIPWGVLVGNTENEE
jgi:hypothetical protein